MASTYLIRSLGASETSTQKGTFSWWLKRASITAAYNFYFNEVTDDNNRGYIQMNTSAQLRMIDNDISTTFINLVTNRLFRDTSAWYHIVIAIDTTQATASDRVKVYVNGVQETSFATETYPSQNANLKILEGGQTNKNVIGAGYPTTSGFLDGSIAHFHYTDGTQYAASDFGETDATTGIWKPKFGPSVTYGTNGFFLKFENSGAFGTDSSGNANNFTVNGTMTQTIDTPSNVFNVFNAIQESPANNSLTNGNTVSVNDGSASGHKLRVGTLGASQGKWYAEFKLSNGGSNYPWMGIMPFEDFNNPDDFLGNSQNSIGYSSNGQVYRNGSSLTSGLTSIGTNDIGMVAFDLDNNYVYFGVNGTWSNSGDPTSGGSGTGGFSITATGKTYTFAVSGFNTNATWQGNFGNGYFGTTAVSSAENPDDGIGIFEYAVPTGYKALCTKSINAQEYD